MPIIICGNKSDLVEESNDVVKKETILEYIKNIPNSLYFEISCKKNTNIEAIRKALTGLDLDVEKIKKRSRMDVSCLIY